MLAVGKGISAVCFLSCESLFASVESNFSVMVRNLSELVYDMLLNICYESYHHCLILCILANTLALETAQRT